MKIILEDVITRYLISPKNIDNSKYLLDDLEIKIEFSNNNNTYQALLNIKISNNKEVVAISTYSKV